MIDHPISGPPRSGVARAGGAAGHVDNRTRLADRREAGSRGSAGPQATSTIGYQSLSQSVSLESQLSNTPLSSLSSLGST